MRELRTSKPLGNDRFVFESDVTGATDFERGARCRYKRLEDTGILEIVGGRSVFRQLHTHRYKHICFVVSWMAAGTKPRILYVCLYM
jgi:hypothetical protein